MVFWSQQSPEGLWDMVLYLYTSCIILFSHYHKPRITVLFILHQQVTAKYLYFPKTSLQHIICLLRNLQQFPH